MTLAISPALVPHQDAGRGGKRPDDDTVAHMARYRPGAEAPDGFQLPAATEIEDVDEVEGHGYKKPADPSRHGEDSDVVPGLHHP
jgi:hypothetical protein